MRAVSITDANTFAYLRGGYQIDRKVKQALAAINDFDSNASDIDFRYTSRPPGAPSENVADRHFHPVAPQRALDIEIDGLFLTKK